MISTSKILIIGSTNTDMVIRTDRFPKPGETILGTEFFMNQGGKGANQAVAAARLGGKVTFVSCVGDDLFGKNAVQSLVQEGVDVTYMQVDPNAPSGVAVITVDSVGENHIVVAPGANATFVPEDAKAVPSLMDTDTVLLLQLEIPIPTVQYLVTEAMQKNTRVVLNPAPAQQLSEELLRNIFILTPNEEEASLLTGIEVRDENSAMAAAKMLKEKGVRNIIITMGAKGAVALYDDEFFCVKAKEVLAVDTTAAGDVFNGALVVAIQEGKSILEAMEFASCAAAIAVTRLGAQSSSPYRQELETSFQKI